MNHEIETYAAASSAYGEAGAAGDASRRAFLRTGAQCLLGCAAGLAALQLVGCGHGGADAGGATGGGPGGGPPLAGPPRPTAMTGIPLESATEAPAGTYLVKGAGKLAAGQAVNFAGPGGSPVVVFKDAAGSLHALSAKCTHSGCTVNYVPAGKDRFVCPCHNSHFSESGANVSGPARKPLPVYKTTAKGDDAEVVVG